MGCCGEPRDKANEASNRAVAQPNGLVTTQPGQFQGMEKPLLNGGYNHQNLPAPPAPTYAQNSMNGYQHTGQQQQGGSPWGSPPGSPPPTQLNSQFTGYSAQGSTGMSHNYDPSGIMRPPSAFNPANPMGGPPMTVTPPLPAQMPQTTKEDEGRLSVSIDFGTSRHHHSTAN
jgi:hypothetical protein